MENRKKNLIIGSNNSMTYLQPSNRYGKLFRFKNKYQRKTIKEQYFEYNVRAFDIKISINNRGKSYFKNNKAKYENYSVFEHLSFLNDRKDCIVKMTLDETEYDYKKGNIEFIEDKFKYICHIFEMCYPNISFIGGTRAFDGKVIYEFENNEYTNYINKELYPSNESIFRKKLRKACPYLHAKMYNEENIIDQIGIRRSPTIMFIDYVDIQ